MRKCYLEPLVPFIFIKFSWDGPKLTQYITRLCNLWYSGGENNWSDTTDAS